MLRKGKSQDMFNDIYGDENLLAIIRNECCENGYEIGIAEELHNSDNVLILKIDAYFNSINMHNPPPSVDCLVMVRCTVNNCYNIYLIELKNISDSDGFDKVNIVSKFQTTIDIFLGNTFSQIFADQTYCNFKCYFVTNPYNFTGGQSNYDEYIHANGLKLDYFSGIEPFEFGGKYALIEPMLPNPTIVPC
jgi:hypothetical protein